jgi:hypothetical protein
VFDLDLRSPGLRSRPLTVRGTLRLRTADLAGARADLRTVLEEAPAPLDHGRRTGRGDRLEALPPVGPGQPSRDQREPDREPPRKHLLHQQAFASVRQQRDGHQHQRPREQQVVDDLPEPTEQPGIPFVTPRNIGDNRLVGEFDEVNPQFAAAKLARYRLKPGDVICTRIGAAVRAGRVSPEQAGWLVGPGCLRLRPAEQVDPGYLTYYLSSPGALQWLDRHAIAGTAIMHISAGRLVQMLLLLPPLSMQRVISELLGALDEELAIEDQISASTRQLRDLWLSRLMSADHIPVVRE